MKSLEKDRLRRYQSASALVAELHRFLNYEPIAARPPSTGDRFRKYLRRHRTTLLVNRAVAKTKSQTRIEGLETQITALRERVAELEAGPGSRQSRPDETEE